jgi:O-antigen/teichoic acid export membrane protein
VLKKALYLAIGNVSSLASVVVSSIVLARFLDLATLWSIKLVFLYGATVAALMSFQIQASVLYFASIEPNRKAEWVGNTIGVFVVLAILTAALFAALSPWFSQATDDPAYMGIMFLVYAPAAGLRLLVGLFPVLAVALDRSEACVRFSVVTGVATIVSIILALNFAPSVLGFLVLDTVAIVASFAFGGWVQLLRYSAITKSQLIPKWDLLKRQVRYSAFLGLANGIKLLGDKIDRFIAIGFLSVSGFGVYTIVAFENPLASVVIIAFMNALIPTLSLAYSRGELDLFWLEWKRSVLFGSLAMLPFTWLSLIYGEVMIQFVFGAKFMPGVAVFKLYSLTVLFRCGSYQSLLRSIGVTTYHPHLAVLSLAVSAFVSWFGYGAFGMPGIALGYVSGHAAYNIAVVILLRVRFAFSMVASSGVLQILRGVLLSALPLFPALLFVTLAGPYLSGPLTEMAAASTVYLVAYVMVLKLTNTIPASAWDAVTGLWDRTHRL